MKHVFCWLCRMALALWADSAGSLPAVFSRHIRRCQPCAAVAAQQQALASRLREVRGQRVLLPPAPALATRVLALARAGAVSNGAGVHRHGRGLRVVGVLAAVVVMLACLVILPGRRYGEAVPMAPLPDSDPLSVFVLAESFLRGDVLQTEWEHLTAETLMLATDLAEEVRVTLL